MYIEVSNKGELINFPDHVTYTPLSLEQSSGND